MTVYHERESVRQSIGDVLSSGTVRMSGISAMSDAVWDLAAEVAAAARRDAEDGDPTDSPRIHLSVSGPSQHTSALLSAVIGARGTSWRAMNNAWVAEAMIGETAVTVVLRYPEAQG